MNGELFQERFGFQMPSAMLKDLFRIKNKKKNNDLINVIKCGLNDLRNEIERLPISLAQLKAGNNSEKLKNKK